jgi:hypothetical protein
MKKYISILSLASVLFMFSCERDVLDLNNPQQKEKSIKIQSDKVSTGPITTLQKIDQNLAANNKEEPKRDKQHWRGKNDTVR